MTNNDVNKKTCEDYLLFLKLGYSVFAALDGCDHCKRTIKKVHEFFLPIAEQEKVNKKDFKKLKDFVNTLTTFEIPLILKEGEAIVNG